MARSGASRRKQTPNTMPSQKALSFAWMLSVLFGGFAFTQAHAESKEEKLSAPWPKDSYYKDYPLFHWYPDEKSTKPQSVYRFGPVGIGIDLTLPAFGMKVKNVEAGSPAEATGRIKAGQIIESINGQKLKDIDPRVFLGNMITQVEATDGKLKFVIKEKSDSKGEEVLVQIPVLGAYSKTWPLNCPKSDKIVRGEADYLEKHGNPLGALGIDQGLLFLLSTGEEKDLEVARDWVKQILAKTKNDDMSQMITWCIGFGAPALCEYYLRTGDGSVLPLIQKIATQASRIMYNGGWNHRTAVNFKYGHLNAAGVHAIKFLLLAKECGVNVDEYTLQTSLVHFFRFAGRGMVPYGNGLPEAGFVDNGKDGGLAFTMAAAASLTPEGENSIYAKARDASATKSFYNTSWMLHGHTGGGIGEVWRSSAMALVYDKQPTKFREFMDNRTWHLDLSRRYNGAITVLRDVDYSKGYDNEMWGAAYAMTYTVPRKTLRMTGAPPSKFSKKYQLPKRPWGTEADDAFYSLVPASDKNGKMQNVDAEKLATDASWPLLRKLCQAIVSDETLLTYARHPNYNVRQMAAGIIRGKSRDHLIIELLKNKDPRVRQAGVMVIASDTHGSSNIPKERLTAEMLDCLLKMIADPNESWWCVINALKAVSIADPKKLAPHVDLLLSMAASDEWWIQMAAINALTPFAADPKYCQKIVPRVAELAAKSTVGVSYQGIVDAVCKSSSPAVRKIGADSFNKAYESFPTKLKAPGGMDMQDAVNRLQGSLAGAVVSFPGGFDELYKISRRIMPEQALPYKDLYFKADSKSFGPELKKAIPKILLEDVVPEYIAKNMNKLKEESRWAVEQEGFHRGQMPVGSIDGLVALYREIDINDYDWRTLGPNRESIRWDYYSYDPAPPIKVESSGVVYMDKLGIALGKVGKLKSELAKRQASIEKLKVDFAKAKAALDKDKSPKNAQAFETVRKSSESIVAALKDMKEQINKATDEANQGFTVGTIPSGMQNWYSSDFDPKKAGWKNGLAPFANVGGKLSGVEHRCKGNLCGCGEMPNTLWDKQILLMRTTLQVQPLKADHRYRLLLGGNIHSHQGGPVLVYINGKAVHQQGGYGGRSREYCRGFFIDKEMAEEFKKGKVNIAIAAWKSDKAYLSACLQEMKIPPLSESDFQKALPRMPMMCAVWQELQDSEASTADPNEGLYRYDGKFVDNSAIRGNWKIVDQVESIEEFTGDIKKKILKLPFETISFNSQGKTSVQDYVWTGNILIALEKTEALAMTPKTINGKLYLFVESGGFGVKNPKGWQSPLFVMEKKQ